MEMLLWKLETATEDYYIFAETLVTAMARSGLGRWSDAVAQGDGVYDVQKPDGRVLATARSVSVEAGLVFSSAKEQKK